MSLSCVILPIVLTKICIINQDIIQQYQLQQLVIVTCVVSFIYIVSNIIFDREENIAIRKGWGCTDEDDESFNSGRPIDEELRQTSVFSIEEDESHNEIPQEIENTALLTQKT